MEIFAQRKRFRMIIPKYPAFNVYSHIAKKTTALGPLCVASSVNKLADWDVEIIDENNYRFPGPVDEEGKPDHAALQEMRPVDAVGFYGGLSCTVPRLMEVAGFYQQAGVFTIGGGHHLDALPEEPLRNGLEVVVNGEGELTICELLQAHQAGDNLQKVQGITYLENNKIFSTKPREPMEDFENLPLPDFGLLRFAKVTVYPINRIRGCGMNCEFCAIKGRARCATPERLAAQISYLVESHQARDFFIVDDQFAQDRAETLRFCELIKDYQARMGLRLFITVQIRLDCARDEKLLNAMTECNIRSLAIGIESPIDEELKAMGKSLRASEMVELAQIFHQHGFLVHGMFIFGYPMRPGVEFQMDIKERIKRFRKFIHQARLDTVQILLPVPLPGTELRARLEKDGRVLSNQEIGWEYYDGNFPIIVPDPPLTPEEIHEAMLTLMGKFYRLRRMLGVAINTLRFPVAMLPLVNLRSRWRKWYRHWRNDVIGSIGYFIIKNWHKAFKKGNFSEKLKRSTRVFDK
ncbi:MAG: radical SAM protein [Planctomycetes bacterium]|nr:radical SAM protein [Planctomycetota bacterium]